MDRFDQKNMRRRVARTLLVSTLVFFLLLGGAFYLQREIPLRRLARIEALLEAGDYAAARPLTERVDDEALLECRLLKEYDPDILAKVLDRGVIYDERHLEVVFGADDVFKAELPEDACSSI